MLRGILSKLAVERVVEGHSPVVGLLVCPYRYKDAWRCHSEGAGQLSRTDELGTRCITAVTKFFSRVKSRCVAADLLGSAQVWRAVGGDELWRAAGSVALWWEVGGDKLWRVVGLSSAGV